MFTAEEIYREFNDHYSEYLEMYENPHQVMVWAFVQEIAYLKNYVSHLEDALTQYEKNKNHDRTT